MADDDIEQAADKAADPVPAEAVEAAIKAAQYLRAERARRPTSTPMLLSKLEKDLIKAALAAAALLIVADRDRELAAYKEMVNANYYFDERMGIITDDEDPVDRVQRLTREVARLTGERDAAEAKIAAVEGTINEASAEQQDFDDACVHIGELRAALAGGDPPRDED